MAYGITITVDDVTRTEGCNQDICLKEQVTNFGLRPVAARLLGVETPDIKSACETGSCEGCPLFSKIEGML